MALSGHYVCFSGFCNDVDEEDVNGVTADATEGGEVSNVVSLHHVMKLASSLGATAQTRITTQTTVLVAGRGLTHKRLIAERLLIPVVSLRWLESHGRLPISDCRVPLLYGYVFCATQMTIDEEKALTSIIESNGGTFNRTLSACISMLFVSPDWLKHFQQLQQKHGRPSTAVRDGVAGGSSLPEKIRFAWATNIPVVDYTRFLSLAALQNNNMGVGFGGGDAGSSRNDFETIAELCALPASVVGGMVPHTQVAGSAVECQAPGADSHISMKKCNDECPNVMLGRDLQRANRLLSPAEETSDISGVPTSQTLFETCNRCYTGSDGHPREPAVGDEGAGVEAPSERNPSASGASRKYHAEATHACTPTASGTVTNPQFLNHVVGTVSPKAHKDSAKPRPCLFHETLFTQSRPFLQISFLGCTPLQLAECARMALRCRFLRTPVVTPFTDVVVIGGELVSDDIVGAIDPVVGPDDVQKRKILSLVQLRDHLTLTYGLPVERMVTIDWLRECCAAETLRNASLNPEAEDSTFEPYPLPVEKVPATASFHLQPLLNMTSLIEADSRRQQPQLEKANRLVLRPQPKSVPTNGQVGPANDDSVRYGKNGTSSTRAGDAARKRHEADECIAVQRFNDLCVLLNGSSDAQECCPALTGCCFSFVENDFSRVDLSVVRALIKYGGGGWVKKTHDEWAKILFDSEVLTTKGEASCSDAKSSEELECRTVSAIRRFTSSYRRLWRTTGEAGSSDGKAPLGRIETLASGPSDGFDNTDSTPCGGMCKPLSEQVFYVIPHGNQRPSDALLSGTSYVGNAISTRHPLRFLPCVTQDFIMCSLAARRLLHPKSCFLFYRSAPTEAERLARRQLMRRNDTVLKGVAPVALSSWLGRRRNERNSAMGITVYFLCLMPSLLNHQHGVTNGSDHQAVIALRRVLLSCLGAATNELCGHYSEKFVLEAVTHVVVVDVGSIFASKAPQIVGESELHCVSALSEFWGCFKVCDTDEEKIVGQLFSRGSAWPRGMRQELLPRRLMEYAESNRISLVGLEWFEASVTWGAFLNEEPFCLPTTITHQETLKENGAAGVVPTTCMPLMYSAMTPPATPARETDVTLLPFSSMTCHSPAPQSPQRTINYQFNFSTPGATPGRDTLHTSGRRCVSTPHFVSPPAFLRTVSASNDEHPAKMGGNIPPHGDLLNGSPTGKLTTMGKDERHVDDDTRSSTNACTPVRRTLVLCDVSDDDERGNALGKEVDSHFSRCGKQQHDGVLCNDKTLEIHDRCTFAGGKRRREGPEMPQQWDPESSRSNDTILEQRPALIVGAGAASSVTSDVVRKQQSGVSFDAPCIYVPNDVPDKEWFASFCAQMDSCASRSDTGGCWDAPDDPFGDRPPSRQHPYGVSNLTKVITRVQIVDAVQRADILVTHQLTQRECVLAAIAAGLWVLTPKVLEDCRARGCLAPLHDLSLYEWSVEALPPDTPQCARQLAKQCRSRRLQRQATGKRLFEDKYFLVVALAPSASSSLTARACSMRNVLETGGGVVAWLMCWKLGREGAVAAVQNEYGKGGKEPLKGSSSHVPAETNVRLPSSPGALLEFILEQIRGSGGIDASGEDTFQGREIVVLLDDFRQKDDAVIAELSADIVETFRGAQQQLVEAKRVAQKKMQCGVQPDVRLNERGPTTEGVEGHAQRAFESCKRAFPVADGSNARQVTGSNGLLGGMPLVGVLSVFKADWMSLTIQQRRRVPLCTVDISL